MENKYNYFKDPTNKSVQDWLDWEIKNYMKDNHIVIRKKAEKENKIKQIKDMFFKTEDKRLKEIMGEVFAQ